MKFRCEIDMNTTDPLGDCKTILDQIFTWVTGCTMGSEPGDLPQDVEGNSKAPMDAVIGHAEFVYDTPKPKRG